MKFWPCACLVVLPSSDGLAASVSSQHGHLRNVNVSQIERRKSVVQNQSRSLFHKRQKDAPNGSQPEENVWDGVRNRFRRGLDASRHGLEAAVPPFLDEGEIEGNHAVSSVHGLAQHILMPGTLIILLSLMLGTKLSEYQMTAWIPESAITMIVAIMFGEVLGLLVSAGVVSAKAFVLASAAILNLILLPIIIFVSGWSLRRGDFLYQFDYIIIFAVLGTLISTFAIGFTSYALANYLGLHVVTQLRSNMAFAALISAVDPVATLVTYKALKVEPLLNIMVLGESTINDAVAVVLFNIINEHWDDFGWGASILRMMELLFGSMIFGFLLALLLVFFMRKCGLTVHHHTNTGIMFIITSAYFIFALAEATHMFSGIIANLIAGIVFSAYGRPQFGKDGESGVAQADFCLDVVGASADHAVFVLCGASTALITSMRGVKFGIISIVLCLLGRALAIIPCGCLTNQLKRLYGDPFVLTKKHLFMMWHAGLRGGIALLLALQINSDWCKTKATIVNGTFMTICFLLIVNGGSTHYFLTKFDIPTNVQATWDHLKNPNNGPYVTKFESFCFESNAKLYSWIVGETPEELD